MTTRNMDSFGQDELAIPEVKLIQNVGGEYAKEQLNAKPGQLYLTSSEEVVDEMEIVVVDMVKTRTFWGRSEIDEDPPECSSLNNIESMDGKQCADCDLRCDTPWLLSMDERRKKCLANFNLLAINFADDMPLIIRASGISTQAVRQLLTTLRMNRQLKGQYHRAVVGVASAKKKSASGDAFAFRFTLKRYIDDKDRAQELLLESEQLLGAGQLLLEAAEQAEPEQLAAPVTFDDDIPKPVTPVTASPVAMNKAMGGKPSAAELEPIEEVDVDF